MTAPEHSHLPWSDDGWGIVDATGRAVPVYGYAPQFAKEAGHRRLIIRAVNAHPALLAAAKKAFAAIELRDGFLDTRIDLQAAIAAAEELAPAEVTGGPSFGGR